MVIKIYLTFMFGGSDSQEHEASCAMMTRVARPILEWGLVSIVCESSIHAQSSPNLCEKIEQVRSSQVGLDRENDKRQSSVIDLIYLIHWNHSLIHLVVKLALTASIVAMVLLSFAVSQVSSLGKPFDFEIRLS